MILRKAINLKIISILDELIDTMENSKDIKKEKRLKKELQKLKELDKAVELREHYEDFLWNFYSDYNEEDFIGKKIMTEDEYDKLMEEWSKITGEKILTIKEELDKEAVEDYFEEHPNLTKEEKVIAAKKIIDKRNMELSMIAAKAERARDKELEMEELSKMSKKERLNYLKFRFCDSETPLEYSGKETLTENKE